MGNIKDMFGVLTDTGIVEPKLLIRLKHKLGKVKINKVLHKSSFTEMDCYDNLTLLIAPQYSGQGRYKNLNESIYQELKKKKGYRTSTGIYDYNEYTKEKTEIKVKIANMDLVIGCYLKDRNIIILYFDVINRTTLSYLFRNELLFFFIDGIINWLKSKKIKKVAVKDFMRKRLIKRYAEEITKEIQNKNNTIESRIKMVSDYEKGIIKDIRENLKDRKLIIELKKMSEKIEDTINKQMKEISELAFVKDVKLLVKGIRVDVGKIYIKWKRKNIFIGEFYAYILPNEVKLENKKPLKKEDGGTPLQHPHINSSNNICWGGARHTQISKLLANYEYKKLMFMVYLFLKTYTDNDKFYHIDNWIEIEEGVSVYNGEDD